MRTLWAMEIRYRDGGGVVIIGGYSLEEAIQRAITDGTYYAAFPNNNDVHFTGWEECAVCYNNGTIQQRRKRSYKVVRCPECKGKPPTARLGRIEVRPSTSVTINLRGANSGIAE